MKRVLVNGAFGRMGQLTCEWIAKQTAFTLAGKAGRNDDLNQMIKETQADIVIDFTTADAAFQNTRTILAAKVKPIIGTSGLKPDDVKALQAYAKAQHMGGAIIPNFSLGAMVLNKLAQQASTYFNSIEIVETHHDLKRDAPSGSAINTAHLLAASRKKLPPAHDEQETLSGARGATLENIHIHALRLPGVMAKETVYFGSPGETISLEHQVINREAYMPGILLACERVDSLTELVYGLEYLVD